MTTVAVTILLRFDIFCLQNRASTSVMAYSYSLYKQFHSMDVMVDETVGKHFSGYAKVISLCNGLSWFPCFVLATWRDVRRK